MSSAAPPPLPFSVASELKALRHEKRNQNLARLPPNATIQRRPLNHAPVADLRSSGAKAPKVVYVSSRTPVVAAIKRVKKYLAHIERRALQDAGGRRGGGGGGGSVTKTHGPGPVKAIEQANEALAKDKEEVLVKASGRAMARALRVGEWFRTKEKDLLCQVEIRAGNVSTVDDIVEVELEGDEEEDGSEGAREESENVAEGPLEQAEFSTLQCGDTTLELLGGLDVSTMSSAEKKSQSLIDEAQLGVPAEQSANHVGEDSSLPKQSRRKRKKRKRPMYEAEDLPEARIRWIKTVEVAITLQT
ncbi:uncharacterized protein PV07_03586 [Cladophialophora immunda]|uniref:Uncharacterized protein n=1 Tax=Cladophialophora immunda TaxID=569365 RepID=A0A0D2D8K1_9EURO|nr:uncharacterized protein PV07_03586 [Cladophialophora immunda]KIW32004.1 hypothetical protein PV07_03586 [Cladophialophora immunda]OQU96699.1 hypothetical protein CLAIMM_02742 [Cladophialophora immunda]